MKLNPKRQYRLPDYNYSLRGGYFVTICTRNQECYFGDIINEKIELSDIGKISKNIWLEIPLRFNNVKLDEYIIMPNHVHGIIIIIKEGSLHLINQMPTKFKSNIINNPMEIKENTLGKIIRWYKGRVKYEINKNYSYNFRWQPRFFEHIIRNEKTLNEIRQYIINNPQKWSLDKENVDNLSTKLLKNNE